eukprot:CAMPEP_0196751220 /NCGR_PEP_ID=MMETSP1091-20130531/83045_1 /TAXON_ID=302021 /ORGANISM="Rhodomonas sp., Strain CCMP768" /LENGTH=271 /DNA_ID=CAMNT_0042098977 /DNA_START=123 /DNA_END=938 /DNA_ORIENTATION=+
MTLPLPGPLFAIARWVGFSRSDEDDCDAKPNSVEKFPGPSNEQEEEPMCIPADCSLLNAHADSENSVPSGEGSVGSHLECGLQISDSFEFEVISERHACLSEKLAPATQAPFSTVEEFCPHFADEADDEGDDEATRKCAETLTRLMLLKNKLAGELGEAKAMNSVVVSSNELKDENLKLRLEIAELQKQVQERDAYIDRNRPGWALQSWNPLGNLLAAEPNLASVASAIVATPRTKARVMTECCSTWLATPVPLGEEAVPKSGFVDKLVTL